MVQGFEKILRKVRKLLTRQLKHAFVNIDPVVRDIQTGKVQTCVTDEIAVVLLLPPL